MTDVERRRPKQSRDREGADDRSKPARKLSVIDTLSWHCKFTALPLLMSIMCLVAPVFAESPEQWYRSGREAVEAAKKFRPINGRAKNVILFVGDGMGMSTVTAARIFEGQLRGKSGEEGLLSFERWQNTAFIKTYTTDQQVSDSAGTMSAIVTGIKTKAGVISVNQRVSRGDAKSADGNSATTILELAEEAGLSTGIVSNTALTHATPAACYAHSPERMWEVDSLLSDAARAQGFPDIARQLIEFNHGDGIEVLFGGGRRHFLPLSTVDPEYQELTGYRLDGRDLTKEWSSRRGGRYIWNARQFAQIDVDAATPILALFEPYHMRFELDRKDDAAGEPSLSDMVEKAIGMLDNNPKGFFLMVEGGRIDHAHHLVNAHRALSETVEFARAVSVAENKTDRNDTLIVVTADHSHVFTMGGYPMRGRPILGKVVENAPPGFDKPVMTLDRQGRPFTTLGYVNGPKRHMVATEHHHDDLSSVDTTDPDYTQETGIDLEYESHGGEDVPLYADGPQAHLFRGVLEQHVIFHVMVEALGLNASKKTDQPGPRRAVHQDKRGAVKATTAPLEPETRKVE